MGTRPVALKLTCLQILQKHLKILGLYAQVKEELVNLESLSTTKIALFIVSYQTLWRRAVISHIKMVQVVNPSMVSFFKMKISFINTTEKVYYVWQMQEKTPMAHNSSFCLKINSS